MGVGYTPSIMSHIKNGTGIGLGLGGPDTTLYSMKSPPVKSFDPVREIDENLREQQEILNRKLEEKRKNRI